MTQEAESESWPLELRIEGNQIDQQALRPRIDSGLLQTFHEGSKAPAGGVKVNLLCRPSGELRQSKAREHELMDVFIYCNKSFNVTII